MNAAVRPACLGWASSYILNTKTIVVCTMASWADTFSDQRPRPSMWHEGFYTLIVTDEDSCT